MVTKPARSLRSKVATFARSARKLAKLRNVKGSNWAKVVADTWLETTFGWKPLLADVRDGAKALARHATNNALERHQFRVYGEDVSPVTATVSGISSGLSPFHAFSWRTSRVTNNSSACILYGVWSARPGNPVLLGKRASQLATLSGLNWEDLPAQVWELIPWSFLVDYFINVGDVIEAAANTFNGPLWVEEVQINETKVSQDMVADVPSMVLATGGQYWFHEDLGSTMQSSYRTVTRLPYVGPLQPTLALRLPVPSQWLNIAALVAGGKPLQPFLK
jgi:hypothetical protein